MKTILLQTTACMGTNYGLHGSKLHGKNFFLYMKVENGTACFWTLTVIVSSDSIAVHAHTLTLSLVYLFAKEINYTWITNLVMYYNWLVGLILCTAHTAH